MIQINYRDTRPFYQQIKDNVRHLVVSGALKKMTNCLLSGNWQLHWPSIRIRSSGLTGNWKMKVISIPCPERAPLRQEMDHTNQIRQQELLPQFDKIVSELLYLSMPVNELTNRILSLSGRRIQA